MALLHMDEENIHETVSARIQQAERRVAPGKRISAPHIIRPVFTVEKTSRLKLHFFAAVGKRGKAAHPVEEDDLEEMSADDFVTISDDEEKQKVIHVYEPGTGGKHGKAGKAKKARSDVVLSKEEKKAIRASNTENNKVAKKCLEKLEPAIKAARKALSLENKPEELEQQCTAAKQVVKEAKQFMNSFNEAQKEFVKLEPFGHEVELCVELKKQIEEHTAAALQLDSFMKGFSTEKGAQMALKALKAAAEKSASATANGGA